MSKSVMTGGAKFRQLAQNGQIACMGAFDGMTARLAEQVGAKAVYVSGFAAAAAVTGYPDLGLIGQTEMADHVRRICQNTQLPVIADGDTGYGGILNAQRTIALWEGAGAAGIHIEDQVFPKRCGHIAGKQVIFPDEMVQKLKACLEARSSSDFFLIARTDALAVHGLADTIDRCKRYADTGVDGIFVDAPTSVLELETISNAMKGFNVSLVFNSARTGKSPFLTEAELASLGYQIVLYPIEALLASHRAVKDVMQKILESGGTNAAADAMSSFKEINSLVQLDEYVKRESTFQP